MKISNLKRLIKYAVIACALIVWTLVLVRLTSRRSGVTVQTENAERHTGIAKLTEPPSLDLSYRDPFHTQVKHKVVITRKSKSVKPIQKVETPKQVRISWPELTYQGMIVNRTKQRRMAVLIIEGKERIFQEGEVYEEMEIQKITADSIYCLKGNQYKTFNKSL